MFGIGCGVGATTVLGAVLPMPVLDELELLLEVPLLDVPPLEVPLLGVVVVVVVVVTVVPGAGTGAGGVAPLPTAPNEWWSWSFARHH